MTKKRVPALSLFSGAGGMDLGFSESGFSTELAVDINAAAVATLRRNRCSRVVHLADLANTSGDALIKQLPGPEPRILIGGPPCQGFSAGNVVQSRQDPRNRLAFDYARILKELASRFPIDAFVFENVQGLLRPKHASRLSRIKAALRSAGYRLALCEVDALDYGVPQTRKRLIVVGTRSELKAPFVLARPATTMVRTVRDTIAHLPEPVFYERGMSSSDVPFHPNHWTMRPKSGRFEQKSFNRWRSFRRLDWDQPSPTVAYGNREIHVHPEGNRRLSVLEAMLLQGFPQTYVLCGTLSQQVTQVSNAVPPPVAKAIGRQLRELLGGN